MHVHTKQIELFYYSHKTITDNWNAKQLNAASECLILIRPRSRIPIYSPNFQSLAEAQQVSCGLISHEEKSAATLEEHGLRE